MKVNLKAMTLGSPVAIMVRNSSALMMCWSWRRMNTQPRNRCSGDTRQLPEEPIRFTGLHTPQV